MPKLELLHHILKWMQSIVSTHKFTGAFLLLALCLTFVIPVLSESVLSSTTIGTGGLVNSSGAMLLFSTDFSGLTASTSSLTMTGQPSGVLALNKLGGNPLKNFFVNDNSNDNFWIDDTTSGSRQYSSEAPPSGHNGQRYVIGMRAVSDRRNEFCLIHVENWLPATKAYYVSVWLYFPTNWNINDWYAIGNPWSEETQGYQHSETHIHKYSSTSWDMAHEYAEGPGGGWRINTVPDFRPPVGQWFNYRYYIHAQTGREVVWVNDQLIADTDIHAPSYDFPSMPAQYLTIPAKIYTTTLPSGGLRLWVSDLQIYDSIP